LYVSLQRDTVSSVNQLIVVQSAILQTDQERLSVERERLEVERECLAIERERLTLEKQRHATDNNRCVIVPADGGSWVYQLAMSGTPLNREC
jgi:hypothetical protein